MRWGRASYQTVSGVRPSLAQLVFMRILYASLFAIVLQIFVWFVRDCNNEEVINLYYVKFEIGNIVKAARFDGSRLILDLEGPLSYYAAASKPAYAFRVLDLNGEVLAASNAQIIETLLPPTPGFGFWLRDLDAIRWFYVAGGATQTVDGHPLTVEVATLGDPMHRHWIALLQDFLEDVWVPILPIILLTIGFTLVSLRKEMKSLATATNQVDATAHSRLPLKLDTVGMPREAAAFASSINRMIERAEKALKSRESLLSFTAHELRRPLAVMLMEIGKITDTRARRLESDISYMNDIVGRLLTMARIEATSADLADQVDLRAISAAAIDQLRSFAEQRSCHLIVADEGAAPVSGDAKSILEAVSNLIENAIKHTPMGTTVRVLCGPGRRLTVEDSGPGVKADDITRLFEPFQRGDTTSEGAGLGLAIVKQAADLNRGSIEVGRSSLGGARFRLVFE